jgi:hypothetical protein
MRRTYVWRDGKLVETTPRSRTNVASTGEYRDKMHSYYELDEVRQQHMIDSNRAERDYNKKRGI